MLFGARPSVSERARGTDFDHRRETITIILIFCRILLFVRQIERAWNIDFEAEQNWHSSRSRSKSILNTNRM